MAKKVFTVKLDDKFLKKVDRIAKKLKISRHRALEQGLAMWVEANSREHLAEKMKAASRQVREESLKETREWEGDIKRIEILIKRVLALS